jgi:16S rRNA G966 N2-methylase RsmD
LSALIGNSEGGAVYDCCAGSGALTIQHWLRNKKTKFICEESDERVIPFLLFNLAVRNIEGYVVHGSALEQKRYKIYKLEKADSTPLLRKRIYLNAPLIMEYLTLPIISHGRRLKERCLTTDFQNLAHRKKIMLTTPLSFIY